MEDGAESVVTETADFAKVGTKRGRKLADCAFEGCPFTVDCAGRNWCANHQNGVERLCVGGDGEQCKRLVCDRNNRLCTVHMQQRTCAALGCNKLTFHKQKKWCRLHWALHIEGDDPNSFTVDYDEVQRIKRNRHLREQHFDRLYALQGGTCAAPLLQCYQVVNGQPTSRCPWDGRVVEPDMMDLDHKTPLYLGGVEDDPNNLQLLCKCCHGAKSTAEQRERSAQAAVLAALWV